MVKLIFAALCCSLVLVTATASQCDSDSAYKRSYSVRHTFGNIYDRNHVASLIDSASAWSAARYKFSSAWVQIDLGKPTAVGGVVTQGRRNTNQWVTTFKVGTSTDGKKFDLVNNGALFSGNGDRSTKKENFFAKREARYVRIYPVGYYGWMSLRADVLVEAGPGTGSPISGQHRSAVRVSFGRPPTTNSWFVNYFTLTRTCFSHSWSSLKVQWQVGNFPSGLTHNARQRPQPEAAVY